MQLVRGKWDCKSILEFQKYLESFSKPEKVKWTKNIINTNLECFAIPTYIIKKIAKEISKGNILSFIDINLTKTYDNLAINGFLIPYIKDFDLMKKYLGEYSDKIDNWAHCDLLKFKVNKTNAHQYFQLALEYINQNKPFVKRVGLIILFKFLNSEYIDRVLDVCDGFTNETEYYVNMCVAWLLCEAFIKQRDSVLKYLKNHKLNDFVINKFVSKCRDSYRVSKEDKERLLKYRKKKNQEK